MSNIEFAQPKYFYLFLLFIPFVIWYIYKLSKSSPSLNFSTTSGINDIKPSLRLRLIHLPFVLRAIALSLVIIILARPQSTDRWEDVTTEGIDVMIALDVSTSMLAQDFKPNRLEAAKDVAVEFISGRPDDRMGLVIFAGESFTQCPLTTDKAVLINLFHDVETDLLEDGTAIGMGLSTAVKRLKDSDAKSKVVILLTDGENNLGDIDPLTAAEIASTFDVRVYTIGVGSLGKVPYPVQGPFGRSTQYVDMPIDEEVLQNIAQKTEGKYFRATNKSKLVDIYKEIDQLEKSKIDVKQHKKTNEEYLLFAVLVFLVLLTEFILRYTWLRTTT